MFENQQTKLDTPYSVRRVRYAMIGLMLSGTVINFLDVLCKLFLGGTIVELTYIIDAIGIVLFLMGLIPIVTKKTSFVISTFLIFAAAWGISALKFSENVPYIQENLMQFFVYCLPFCWIGYELVKSGEYLSFFLKVCRIKLIVALVTQIAIFAFPRVDIFNGDYMSAANAMIVGTVSVYQLAASEHRKIDIFLSILATVVLIICGSRGVFVSLVCYWIIYIIFGNLKNKATWITILTAIVTCFSLFFYPIMEGISKIAESVGFSTHLIDALVDASIFDDEIRLYLFENFWKAITKSPFGYGVMGDRYLSLSFNYIPIYPHNLFLELMINFGYVGGTLASIWLLIRILKAFLSKNRLLVDATIVLFSATFVRLMVSNSFWSDQIFFLLLGVCLAGVGKKKKKTEELQWKRKI